MPVRGPNVVDVTITALAVFERTEPGRSFKLIECAPGTTLSEIAEKTTAAYEVALPEKAAF